VDEQKDYADLDLPPPSIWMRDVTQILYFFAALSAVSGILIFIAWLAGRFIG